jgi:hypothetical protein
MIANSGHDLHRACRRTIRGDLFAKTGCDLEIDQEGTP